MADATSPSRRPVSQIPVRRQRPGLRRRSSSLRVPTTRRPRSGNRSSDYHASVGGALAIATVLLMSLLIAPSSEADHDRRRRPDGARFRPLRRRRSRDGSAGDLRHLPQAQPAGGTLETHDLGEPAARRAHHLRSGRGAQGSGARAARRARPLPLCRSAPRSPRSRRELQRGGARSREVAANLRHPGRAHGDDPARQSCACCRSCGRWGSKSSGSRQSSSLLALLQREPRSK